MGKLVSKFEPGASSLSGGQAEVDGKRDLKAGLQEILEAAIKKSCAFKGVILLETDGKMSLAAQKGIDPQVLTYKFPNEGLATVRALRSGRPVIIPDIDKDEAYAIHRHMAAVVGYRALHAIPILNKDNKPIGVLSLHYQNPTTPGDELIELLDLYVRKASSLIQSYRRQESPPAT